MTKEQKAEYDRGYRLKNKERLKLLKSAYCKSEAGRLMQKKQRIKNKESGYHNEFCRKPEQRQKEKLRRHIRENKTILRKCLLCDEEKQIIEFNSFPIFPDKRNYQCKECQYKQEKDLGLTTRQVLGCIRSVLVKTKSNLKISDIVNYPYLIESYKYLLSLKQLTK